MTGIFKKQRGFIAGATLWLAACTLSLYAQSGATPDKRMERDLARAEAYLYSFKNDSALLVARQLLDRLKSLEQADSPFGLRVQLAEAAALEQDQQGDLAITKLLRVIEQSEKRGLPDISAKAGLALALLYEKVGLKANSLEHLQRAQTHIDRHALDSIYPYFAVRMASWQRLYGDKDSAIYFAREALRTAPLFRLDLEEAIGHLLMNLLLPPDAVEARLQHSLAAIGLYRKLEDYTGCSYMYGAVARIYFQKGNTRLALTYNDSTLAFAHRAIAGGHKQHAIIGRVYHFRSELYRKLGQLDSAFFYLNKGNQEELNLLREDNKARIIEIDARLNNEKKQIEIDRQRLDLVLKKRQLIYTSIIFGLVCLLAIGLLVGLHKQRQGKRALAEQNTRIREQAEQLKSLDAAKSRFFANVSHELRTPLTLLLGPIQSLLKENHLTAKQAHLLQLARQSGKQLEQLVNEILDLRKLEQGHTELHRKPTELPAFAGAYLAQFESLAERKQIHFSVQLPPGNTPAILLDREKFRQILFNLLANAFKFTPNGGRIEAAIALEGGMLRLRVTDNGPGIHPDDLPHLFDRYFQTTRPDKPAEGGTGIGLALCREYARLFGGAIEVDSTPGKGSVFQVTFPVAPAETGALAMPDPSQDQDVLPVGSSAGHSLPAASEPSGKAKPTILVVEDNLALQDYIHSVLQEKYHVVTAENGQAALDLMMNDECRMMNGAVGKHSSFIIHHSSFPDLILSDLMMPVMDGYQLLEKLKSDDVTRHIPVIMLTARAEAQDKLKALRIGVDDYLHKPFDEEELLARIGNLLKNQAARQQEVAAEETPRPIMSQPDREWLETFEQYVRRHLSSDTLSIAELSRVFTVSESNLLRRLKRLTGLTPLQYLMEVRLTEARRLLENRACDSVAQVAGRVGYDDARSFSRAFRQRFGKLPSEV